MKIMNNLEILLIPLGCSDIFQIPEGRKYSNISRVDNNENAQEIGIWSTYLTRPK